MSMDAIYGPIHYCDKTYMAIFVHGHWFAYKLGDPWQVTVDTLDEAETEIVKHRLLTLGDEL